MGHADLVEGTDGSWWMICLGYRTSGYLQHVMGRETFLAPVRWDKDAWPVVNGNGTIQLEMDCPTLPQVPMPEEIALDHFDRPEMQLFWSYLCNPDTANYSLEERKGFLRMKASDVLIDSLGSPTFVGRRQTELNFQATACLDASGLKEGDEAGIVAYAARLNHYETQVTCRNGHKYVQAVIRIGQMKHIASEVRIDGHIVYLRITSDKDFYHLWYSEDNRSFKRMASMEYRYLSTETIGGFTGVHLGLFAQNNGSVGGYADFDFFDYQVTSTF